jgi:hypothetical protein
MESVTLQYNIQIVNVDQTIINLKQAERTASQTSKALTEAEQRTESSSRTILRGISVFTNLRQTVDYTIKGLKEADPMALLMAFMNLLQTLEGVKRLQESTLKMSIVNAFSSGIETVITSVKSLFTWLQSTRAVQAAIAGIQAMIATLSGQWWLVAAAIAAGVAVAAAARSMQMGGPVLATGVYLLHKGEYVVPAETVNRFGPIYVGFTGSPTSFDGASILRQFGAEIARRARRSGV